MAHWTPPEAFLETQFSAWSRQNRPILDFMAQNYARAGAHMLPSRARARGKNEKSQEWVDSGVTTPESTSQEAPRALGRFWRNHAKNLAFFTESKRSQERHESLPESFATVGTENERSSHRPAGGAECNARDDTWRPLVKQRNDPVLRDRHDATRQQVSEHHSEVIGVPGTITHSRLDPPPFRWSALQENGSDSFFQSLVQCDSVHTNKPPDLYATPGPLYDNETPRIKPA